ncbi:hypothetical protein E2C01_095353 [Portunus trituberculatus]|uniref:Uncharacterized protein n=1 Tax=Portunus trituberculatus TaxID=210409 RepID=A0A5B7K3K4_PORTR|nr:hypothetical protein [Portunus trituberculatus]
MESEVGSGREREREGEKEVCWQRWGEAEARCGNGGGGGGGGGAGQMDSLRLRFCNSSGLWALRQPTCAPRPSPPARAPGPSTARWRPVL